ncbi:pseudouridine synthase [Treponema sp.]|uniref:pseudouridine synthase n=1 Tax=Treponema sp. TaxID=166 RepID=UPI0025ED72FA|nr:pseudouridine synthase [Treponema sp.]MCR5217547.1 pseudouridine synthase [Treponema sp.]
MPFLERTDVILARRGFSTNKKIRRFLQRNVFEVNGQRILSGGTRINLFEDTININGSPSDLQPDIYIMMNKKSGRICSNYKDPNLKTDPTLVFQDLPQSLKEEADKYKLGTLHTVGRLDSDTEGLLIITTNGDYSHRITIPEFHCDKNYYIKLQKECSPLQQEDYIKKCSQGFFIEAEHNYTSAGYKPAFTCKPSQLTFFSPDECSLTISEGKFHQVKRMIKTLGNQVTYLKRTSMGNLHLDPSLLPGHWRPMTQDEILSVIK